MKKRYRNIAFLTELLINIFVFSISCAILVGLFGSAGIMARKTREKSFAGTETYALLEMVRAQGAEGLVGAEERGDGTFACYYDEKWGRTSAEGAAYEIEVAIAPVKTAGGTLSSVVAVCHTVGGEEIFRLETSVYHPEQGGGAA